MCLLTCSALLVAFAALLFLLNVRRSVKRGAIGFLHPASGGGGGGERVLWVAIQHLLAADAEQHVVLYTSRFPPSPQEAGDDAKCTEYLLTTLVPRQFGICIDDEQQRRRLRVRYIPLQWLQDPGIYPVARLLLQSVVGGFALAAGVWYAELTAAGGGGGLPSLFVDSVGIPFSYVWLRLTFLRSRVGAYVHYPFISADMIDSVVTERAMPNNPQPAVGAKKALKLLYYRAMVLAYRYLGGRPLGVNGPVACNSTWTRGHIVRAWAPADPERDVRLLFPPVNVAHLRQIPVDRSRVKGGNAARPLFIAVGQFRPEKDHPLLIRAFARALRELRADKSLPPFDASGGSLTDSAEDKRSAGLPKLVIIGGARNEEDRQRAEGLKQMAASDAALELLPGDVEFRINAPFSELEGTMQRALAGVHTMRDEHFGIVVVEYMASGCICVAHRSAGPLEIVGTDRTRGFLCATEEEYAATMAEIVREWRKDRHCFDALRERGRASTTRFSDEAFGEQFRQIYCGK